jgi:hypothetical protein
LSLLRAALQEALPRDEEIATPIYEETADVAERVTRATTAFLRLILKRETLVRAVMALSLLRSMEAPANRQEAVALRPGYRLAWIAEALAPLEGRIDADALRRLMSIAGRMYQLIAGNTRFFRSFRESGVSVFLVYYRLSL